MKASPTLILGPCSAESKSQLRSVAQALKGKIDFFRAGIWKPRSSPSSFQGLGQSALDWLYDIQKEFNLPVMTEVGTPEHVELCLAHGIHNFWIGARTTTNPFLVRELAQSLEGQDATVFVKNPINPDLALWLGALESFEKKVPGRIGAIHRGFSSFENGKYRNIPLWRYPLEVKRERPDLEVICDPSHIAGLRENVSEIACKAMAMGLDGLMIETHPYPEQALSDARQQLTPQQLLDLISQLPKVLESDHDAQEINELRKFIDCLDQDLLECLHRRKKVVDQIAKLKLEKKLSSFQVDRFRQIIEKRSEWAQDLGIGSKLVSQIFSLIHEDALKQQLNLMKEDQSYEKSL